MLRFVVAVVGMTLIGGCATLTPAPQLDLGRGAFREGGLAQSNAVLRSRSVNPQILSAPLSAPVDSNGVELAAAIDIDYQNAVRECRTVLTDFRDRADEARVAAFWIAIV